MLIIAGGIVLGCFAIVLILAFGEWLLLGLAAAMLLALATITVSLVLLFLSDVPSSVIITVTCLALAVVPLAHAQATARKFLPKTFLFSAVIGALCAGSIGVVYVAMSSIAGEGFLISALVTGLIVVACGLWFRDTSRMLDEVAEKTGGWLRKEASLPDTWENRGADGPTT
ncbi:MAG: hypothetical protein ACRBBU_03950 [Pseudooceanicola sp.]